MTPVSTEQVAAPNNTAASEKPVESWRVLEDAAAAHEGESFCDYASMEVDTVATEQLTDDDFVLGAARAHERSDDECVEDTTLHPVQTTC